jgi:DNA-binding FadR family transcriptional regulator
VGRRRDLVIPPILLDRGAPEAIYRQLADQLARAIRRGAFDGARLPSTRDLAPLLGVSRNTVLAAYDELVALGLVEARAGSGMRVPCKGRVDSLGLTPQRVLRDAQYPVRALGILDMDGGSLYLTY